MSSGAGLAKEGTCGQCVAKRDGERDGKRERERKREIEGAEEREREGGRQRASERESALRGNLRVVDAALCVEGHV